ncbi:MAG: hypothetical protein HYR96_11465 [Deltaproteobacteria bacterium]|nr:hypothetical protein [Deltaproteobacteria bacterium]MBI3294267.1 hypothetical protein [Deltaproteobacteria bacterium]
MKWNNWLVLMLAFTAHAAPPVPGTGQKLSPIGDDFEDPKWTFVHNLPKSSEEQDHNVRRPTGYSHSTRSQFISEGASRIIESEHRGAPDTVERVETPAGGIPGSKGALKLQTLHSGVPGVPSGKQMQDDLMVNNTMNGQPQRFSARQNPGIVVRVFVPPFDQWKPESSSSFGFRIDANRENVNERSRRGRQKEDKDRQYWPGFFMVQNYDQVNQRNVPQVLFRAGQNGFDVPGPELKQPGWYTLGMSFTGDGMVHYFMKQGVGDLTAGDHQKSLMPYGNKNEFITQMFFNVTNADGKTWSAPWVIDDPSMYLNSR